jgi:CheY-like chemotaxis protein
VNDAQQGYANCRRAFHRSAAWLTLDARVSTGSFLAFRIASHGAAAAVIASGHPGPVPLRPQLSFRPRSVGSRGLRGATDQSPMVCSGGTMDSTRVIRVVTADSHTLFAHGIARLLDSDPRFNVVGEATDGRTAVRMCVELKPDALLLDVSMPIADGLLVLRRLPAEAPAVRCIFVATRSPSAVKVMARHPEPRPVVFEDALSMLRGSTAEPHTPNTTAVARAIQDYCLSAADGGRHRKPRHVAGPRGARRQ